MASLASSIRDKGFVLIVERTMLSPSEKVISVLTQKDKSEMKEEVLEKAFKAAGLTLISKRKDQITSVIYLLRKIIPFPDMLQPKIITLNGDMDFDWVEELKLTLKEYEEKPENPDVWLISQNPTSGIVGLVNCLRQEPGGKRIRYVLNGDFGHKDRMPEFQWEEPFYQDVIKNDLPINVFRNGQWGNFRHSLIDRDPIPVPRADSVLQILNRGDLSSLTWLESPLKHRSASAKSDSEVLVQVYYAALNFRDVMLASGKLPPDAISRRLALQDCLLGLEIVGRDPAGRRVMGLTLSKGLATTVSTIKEALVEVPEKWSMEEASTVVVVYTTAYYALLVRGGLRKGQSVLIHSGTGGVGQAAISIALAMGCQVFTTVGSEEKREFLKSTFPQLDDKYISNSRTTDFEFDVMNTTNGAGVDMVLNSLADDKLQASVRCLKYNGVFLEIGKYDIIMNSNLGMASFGKNIAFHGIHLDVLIESEGDYQPVLDIWKLLKQGIEDGVVRPLKANVYNWDQAEEAFRFMASGKHVGKVVLKIRDEEENRIAIPVKIELPSVPRTYFPPSKSYIITGGLGGFGLELAHWLVGRGARFILLSTRTGIHNNYQRLWIQRWRSAGVQVSVSNQGLSTPEGTRALLKEATDMAPVGGIFHLAMVLHDGIFENLKSEDFEEVCIPKISGVHNLDELSREMCQLLDYFVVFSSISCGRGNPGQSNYGYANSVMERVVEKRKHDGLPGLAIQWGGIGDVGVVYDKMGGNEVVLKGTVPQRLNSCLNVLDRLMQEDHAVVSSFVPVEKAAFSSGSREDVVAMLCKVLGIKDPSTVKPDMTLGELGMDSLMGVEIKQVLETEYDTELTVPEVRLLTIKQLEEIGKKKTADAENLKTTLIVDDKAATVELHIPSEVLVTLNSVAVSQCVFFFHPAEGHTLMFKALAKNINKKVYGVQFTDDAPTETLQELAAHYIKNMKTVQPHGPYHLLGYSFGAMIAMEVAKQLQKTDQVKTLFCIDGSPFGIKEMSRIFIKSEEKEDLRVSSTPVLLFMKTILGQISPQVEESLKNLPLQEVMTNARELLREHLGELFDEEIAYKISERIYTVTWMLKKHESTGVFRGKTTLVKSNGEDFPEEAKHVYSTENYNLAQDVDGPIECITLPFSHKEIIFDKTKELSTIINDRIKDY